MSHQSSNFTIRQRDTFLAASKNTSLLQARHTFVLPTYKVRPCLPAATACPTRPPQPRSLLPSLPVLIFGCPRQPPEASCSCPKPPRLAKPGASRGPAGEGAGLRRRRLTAAHRCPARPEVWAHLSPAQPGLALPQSWEPAAGPAAGPARPGPSRPPLPRPRAEPSSPANAPRRGQRRPRGASPRPRTPPAARAAAAKLGPGEAPAGAGDRGRTCTARLRKVPASAASFFTLKSMMFIFGGGGGADSARAPAAAAAAAAPARPCGEPPGGGASLGPAPQRIGRCRGVSRRARIDR